MRTTIQPFAALMNELSIGMLPTGIDEASTPHAIVFGPDSFVNLCRPARNVTAPLMAIPYLHGSGAPHGAILSRRGHENTTLAREHKRLRAIAADAEERLAEMKVNERELENWALQYPVSEPSPKGLSGEERNADEQAQLSFFQGVLYSKFTDIGMMLIRSANGFSSAESDFTLAGNHTAAALAAELGAYVFDLAWLAAPDDVRAERSVKSTGMHRRAHQLWYQSLNEDMDHDTKVIRMFQGLSLAMGVLDWEHALSYLKIVQRLNERAATPKPAENFTLRKAWVKLHERREGSTIAAADLMTEVAQQWQRAGAYPKDTISKLQRIAQAVRQ